jgi:hypothetical protein
MSGMRDRLARIERGLEVPRDDALELVNWVYSEQRAPGGRPRRSSARLWRRFGRRHSSHCRAQSPRLQGRRFRERRRRAAPCRRNTALPRRPDPGAAPGAGVAAVALRRAEGLPPGYYLELELGLQWKGEPRYEASGRPKQGAFKVVHDGSNAKVAPYCPLEWSHGADYQAEMRREYEHWHLALRCLVEACARVDLGRLVVTGPAISREPWIDRGRAHAAA